MTSRTITIHAFCSVKGGVGKSTLAVASAKMLAKQGRRPALLDCDLSGTSLADGLRLRAPRVKTLSDGSIDLGAAPTGELADVEETRRLRGQRAAQSVGARPHPPPYLNDLLAEERELHVEAFCWQHEREDGVLYLPSSSIRREIIQSLEWFYGDPFSWAKRLTWKLDDFAHQMPALTDVVIDLPPGVWGFAHEALTVLSALMRSRPLPDGFPEWQQGSVRWKANPVLVLTGDMNDLLPAMEYVGEHIASLPTLQPVVNRATEGIEVIRARAKELLGPIISGMRLEQKLVSVAESRGLARLFKDGDVSVDQAAQDLDALLRSEKGR